MSLKYEPSSEPQAAVIDVHITRMATAKIADRSAPPYCPPAELTILQEKSFNLKLSGNEVNYTA